MLTALDAMAAGNEVYPVIDAVAGRFRDPAVGCLRGAFVGLLWFGQR